MSQQKETCMDIRRTRASKAVSTLRNRVSASRMPPERGIVGAFLMEKVANHRQLLKRLLARRSVRRGGSFTLSSGKKSQYYIDCKLTTLDPEGAVLTGYTIFEYLRDHRITPQAIGGMSIGADPIVTAVAAVSYLEGESLPAFIVRKEAKGHGLKKSIEGINVTSAKVVIVDDVCTEGCSTLDAIAAAQRAGLEVIAVISLVDREEGGSDLIRRNHEYHSIFTAKELLEEYDRATRELGEDQESAGQKNPLNRGPA
jgi:orotate phosphoribosyltransferase